MSDDARALVRRFGLAPHPEGGFFKETFRSAARFALPGYPGERAASTAIHFLLEADTFSAFHRVRSDEVWHHYAGDPLELHTIDDDGHAALVVLGPDFEDGQVPQAVVPRGVWQAAAPRGSRYAFVGCTVAPGFDFADFEMPPRTTLLALFPRHTDLLTRFTRANAPDDP
ncbi:MAG: cupin domain-containing protein [Polyangiaceae bacterium]